MVQLYLAIVTFPVLKFSLIEFLNGYWRRLKNIYPWPDQLRLFSVKVVFHLEVVFHWCCFLLRLFSIEFSLPFRSSFLEVISRWYCLPFRPCTFPTADTARVRKTQDQHIFQNRTQFSKLWVWKYAQRKARWKFGSRGVTNVPPILENPEGPLDNRHLQKIKKFSDPYSACLKCCIFGCAPGQLKTRTVRSIRPI